jgi:hypothetical protein
MNGAGNSNSIIMYEYLDNSIENNNNYYYRLKQTDFDGKFTYSNSIYVSSKEESLNIISLLNSEDNITLNITNTEAKGIVELIGLDGKIYDSRILKKSDNQSITFNKGEYSHGIYLIKLKNANTVITRKVVL